MNINSGLARGHIVIIMRFVRKGGCWSAVGLRDEAERGTEDSSSTRYDNESML